MKCNIKREKVPNRNAFDIGIESPYNENKDEKVRLKGATVCRQKRKMLTWIRDEES